MVADNHSGDGADGEAWLSVYEVAGRMLARPDTVRAWIRDGLLPAEHRGRLGLRVPEAAVSDFLSRHLRAEGFRSADHSFSSGVGETVLTATDVPEQAVERQGAGWPFRRDSEDQPDTRLSRPE